MLRLECRRSSSLDPRSVRANELEAVWQKSTGTGTVSRSDERRSRRAGRDETFSEVSDPSDILRAWVPVAPKHLPRTLFVELGPWTFEPAPNADVVVAPRKSCDDHGQPVDSIGYIVGSWPAAGCVSLQA